MPGALRRLVAAGTAAVVAGGLLAACSSHGSGTTIVLYNGQHPQTTAALVSAFERATGITVLVRNGEEAALADQILAEGRASPADVFFAENSPALWVLQEHGLLAHVQAPTLAAVPARFSSPTGEWVGVTARVSMLVYNTNLLRRDQLPSSVLQLAAPQWKGRLALAAGETDFQPIVTAVEHRAGRAATIAWLHGLKQNAAAHLYPDNESLIAHVNDGAAALGIVNQYYWYRLRAQLGAGAMHSALAPLAAGDPGYVVNVSGAAVLASSGHAAAAQRFLAFLVSKEGQLIIAHGDSFEYPLRPGVPTATPEVPFASLDPYPLSPADLGDGSAAIALLRQVQLL